MSKDQNHEDYQEQDDNRPLTLEEQRARLRQLIIMGKERGYITYSEINDALPDDMSDADQIDNNWSDLARTTTRINQIAT